MSMMRAREVQEWLESLIPDDTVAIDDGGLTLAVVGREDEAYLEVGGIPRDNDRWEGE
jgi:hypothetical protein